ncbi:MAG: hypothetical protein WC204_10765 [Elusimicrobiales bacterium]
MNVTKASIALLFAMFLLPRGAFAGPALELVADESKAAAADGNLNRACEQAGRSLNGLMPEKNGGAAVQMNLAPSETAPLKLSEPRKSTKKSPPPLALLPVNYAPARGKESPGEKSITALLNGGGNSSTPGIHGLGGTGSGGLYDPERNSRNVAVLLDFVIVLLGTLVLML